MQRRTLFSVVAVAACGAALWAASNPKPVNWHDLPEPFHTPSASNRPQVVDRPEGAQLSLPDGFTADVFAEGDFNRPRYMLLGQNDEILLSDSGDRNERNGAVYALSLDGKIEKKVLEGLDRPYGLQLHEDWLYVAETTSVKRYKYDGESRTAQTPGEQLVDMSEFGDGHWTRTLLFTPDHSKFYLTIGSASNIDLNEDPMRAALHRYNPDGSGHETVATGLRNIIGLRFYPGTTDLWAAVQERDGLGDNLVPDYLVKIQEGGFYGWPIAYTGPHEEPRHKGVNPEKVQQSLYPDVLLGAHVAVLVMNFY